MVYRKIQLRVSEYEWTKFKELKDKGFSARAVIEIITQTCTPCTDTEILVFNKNNQAVKIKKKILNSNR